MIDINALKKYLFFSLILSFSIFAQDKRYTKGAENGYSWYEMDKPALMFNTTKETYLASILERYRLTEEVYPEISSFSCRDDIKNLSLQSSTNDILLEDVVDEIDKFYFKKDNLIIPIIFAYCYTIKKFFGVSKRELNNYRESVLNFCNE
jgi:hypothetical protein